jgi:hypothetical protein
MNIQANRTEYQDVEGLRGLYHQESEASAILLDTVGELSESISRPGGAMDISRRRSPSVGAGTDQKGFFASRQGRRTRIRDRNNPGPAPFHRALKKSAHGR